MFTLLTIAQRIRARQPLEHAVCRVNRRQNSGSLRRRGRVQVLFDDAVAVQFQPGTVTGSARRPPTAPHMSRAPGAPIADRPADQLRRPDRFHPSADRA